MEAMTRRTGTSIRSGAVALVRAVRTAGTAVAGLIVAAILLVVLDADPSNGIVEAVTDVGRWLTEPFHGVFDLDSRDGQLAANWGLAAAVYFAISRVIAGLMARGISR